MKARDIMIPIKPCLSPEDGIEVFISRIREVRADKKTCGITALPVLNTLGRIVGMLSMYDFFRAMHPAYLDIADLHLFTWDGMLESLAERIKGKKVSNLMTAPVRSVQDDHPLMECVDHMLKYRISSVPVVDREGKFVGMLYESDIFFAVTKVIQGGM